MVKTNQTAPDDLYWSRRLSVHAGSLIESAKGQHDHDPSDLTNADARSYGEMLDEVREYLEAQATRIKKLMAEVENSKALADIYKGQLDTFLSQMLAAEARATKAEALLSEWMDWQAKATADDDCEWLNDEGWPKIEGLARRTREALSEGKA